MRSLPFLFAALLLPSALHAQRVDLMVGRFQSGENALLFEGAYTHTLLILPGNKGLAGSVLVGYWDQIPSLFRKVCFQSPHDYPCEAFYAGYLGSRLHFQLLRRPFRLALTAGGHFSSIRSRYLDRPGGRTLTGRRWTAEYGVAASLPLSKRLWLSVTYRLNQAVASSVDTPFEGGQVMSLGLAYGWR